MLDLLEEGLGEPVDVEFAHDGQSLFMLQCRALSRGAMAQRVEIPDVPEANKVFSANRYVQMGQVPDLEYVVLIDPRDYESLETREAMVRVARTVGAINKALPAQRFILMGPGRWGSRGDIRLGVPVTYADISRTSVLVEIARKKGSYLPGCLVRNPFLQRSRGVRNPLPSALPGRYRGGVERGLSGRGPPTAWPRWRRTSPTWPRWCG